MFDASFFGVYNKHGELEAVESTEGAAFTSACNLSPGSGGKPPPAPVNRTVEPVIVVRGDLGTFMVSMLTAAADVNIARLTGEYNKALKQCTTHDDKTGKPVVVSNNALHEAKERLRTAVELRAAIGEV